jgi:hypothetical protein
MNILALAVLALVNGIVYYDYWLGDKIFSGKDFLTAFYPLINFQSDCLQDGSWPLWNPFMNFGFPYVEHYINSALFPTHLIMGLVSGSSVMILQREILLWIIVGGFGVYLCVRELGLSPLTGILAGASFMACGQITALPQWNSLTYNAACFPYLILGYHRAKVRGTSLNALSVAFLTFSILGGYTVTTVLGIYLFAGYVLLDAAHSRKVPFALRYLAVTGLASCLLALPKLLPLYAGLNAGPRLASAAPPPGAPRDTFNIISVYNLWSLLLPVKFYFSLFLGSLGVLAFVSALLRREVRVSPLLAMTVLSGWLLLSGTDGSPSLLRSLASFLPFMHLVRNEWLSWFYPSIFAILFLAPHVESFLTERTFRDRAIAAGICSGLLSLGFVLVFDARLYAGAYATHLVIMAAWACVGFLPEHRQLRGALAIMLVTAELVLVFSRVSVDVPPLKDQGRILYTIVDQGSVSRSYEEDNGLRSGFRAVAVQDHLRPSIDDARNRPVLISGLSGDPTYNLYPEQYGRFIDFMNLKRFSGWWYNTQERFDFIRLKDSPLLGALEGQSLFQLYDLGNGSPLPDSVSFTKLTCAKFSFTVNTTVPSFLLLRQMFDDRWSVRMDGQRTVPVRAEEFFMGVPVGPGAHHIDFLFSDPRFTVGAWISFMTLVSLISLLTMPFFRSRLRRRT